MSNLIKKNFSWTALWLALVFGTLFIFSPKDQIEAASLTKGVTFTNSMDVTPANLNALVDDATVTGVATADINNGAITTGKLAADSVTSAKVVNNTLVGGTSGDLATNTVETANIKDGTITADDFNATIDISSGSTWNFTNSVTVAFETDEIDPGEVSGVTTSAGAADSGKIPKLDAAGILDNSIVGIETGRSVMSSDVADSTAYQTLVSVTPTATNGTIIIWATAHFRNDGAGDPSPLGARLYDGTTELIAAGWFEVGGDTDGVVIPITYSATLSGSTTFNLQGISGTALASGFWSGQDDAFPTDSDVHIKNATRIDYMVIP